MYRQLAELPLERLKETTQGRLRLGAIEAAGYRTVGQAGAAGVAGLQQIPGVGPQTATQVIAAARQLSSAMMQRVRLRFDPDARPPLQARLLAELHAYGVARQAASPGRENLDEMAAALDAVLAGSRRAVSRLRMFFSGSRKRDEARSALSLLEGLMRSVRQSGLDTRLQQSLADLAAQTPTLPPCGETTRNGPSSTTGCSSRSASSHPTSKPGRASSRPTSRGGSTTTRSTSR